MNDKEGERIATIHKWERVLRKPEAIGKLSEDILDIHIALYRIQCNSNDKQIEEQVIRARTHLMDASMDISYLAVLMGQKEKNKNANNE